MVSPYWIYQYYLLYGKKILFISVLLGLGFSGVTLIYLQNHARFEEDASYMTRAAIYEIQINGILSNYIVIPHGANAAYSMVRNFTNDVNFSAHNDILRYLYDWGVVFIYIIGYIIRKFKKQKLFNLNFTLIILAYMGFALHNLLFLPYVWIPFIFLIVILTNHSKIYENNVSSCEKIQ